MKEPYRITEYGSFITGKEIDGYTTLPASTFSALENFILQNNDGDNEALEIMGLSSRKGIGKIITATNYVGVIAMTDGTSIEILPKVYSSDTYTYEKAKKLLIDMLKTLKDTTYKSFQTTNVSAEKMNIFEIFIRMYIDEIFFIVKRGLKCNYETVQSNENVYKGKMLFSKQIKHNFIHKEKSYVEYDVFNVNRAENKLIKATLQYLYKTSSSIKNKNDIKTLLHSFTEVEASLNYQSDFSKVVSDRNMKDYTFAMLWSKVFLSGKSFTSFSGSEIAVALLFPMETLFESYIAVQLKRLLNNSDYTVSAQDKTHHLFENPTKFLMKPDIVIKNDSNVFVMDTKWKLLSEAKANYGISQADMYQMYAYQKKYNAQNVTLLYPMTDKVDDKKVIEYSSLDGAVVRAKFVDLFNVKESLSAIINDIIYS
ncbi:MAG: McrC family protein [Ruminiclostridium sp.]|nr:McrC family protein [Ruminiclostridium sp.]